MLLLGKVSNIPQLHLNSQSLTYNVSYLAHISTGQSVQWDVLLPSQESCGKHPLLYIKNEHLLLSWELPERKTHPEAGNFYANFFHSVLFPSGQILSLQRNCSETHFTYTSACCEHSPILCSVALAHNSAHLCNTSEISMSPRVSKESKYHYNNVLVMFPLRLL